MSKIVYVLEEWDGGKTVELDSFDSAEPARKELAALATAKNWMVDELSDSACSPDESAGISIKTRLVGGDWDDDPEAAADMDEDFSNEDIDENGENDEEQDY